MLSTVKVFYDSPESYSYTVYHYDENEKLIQKQDFDEYGEGYGMKYEYDREGRKIKDIQRSPFIWVKEGNSTMSVRNKTGTDLLYREYFYDENSNLIQEKRYGAGWE